MLDKIIGGIAKMRPSKLRLAVRRRWFENALSRLALDTAQGELFEAGTAYGGWIVPAEIDVAWTCYCIGMGPDVSLERHLLERGATVRSVEPVERYVIEGREKLSDLDRFTADHAAIATFDGTIEMQRHHQKGSASLSAAGLYESSEVVRVPAVTFESLMASHGDERIDLLKLDVEGLEYDLMPTLDLKGMGIRAFAVQLHHNGGVARARQLIRHVEAQGFALVAQRPVAKLTFLATER